MALVIAFQSQPEFGKNTIFCESSHFSEVGSCMNNYCRCFQIVQHNTDKNGAQEGFEIKKNFFSPLQEIKLNILEEFLTQCKQFKLNFPAVI